jgi:peptidoglycan hydrolase-like protein with peptidoglycan-binding domain
VIEDMKITGLLAPVALPARLRAGAVAVLVFFALAVVGWAPAGARIAGDAPSVDRLLAPPPNPLVRRIQEALGEAGLYDGRADGRMNLKTEASVRAFQKRAGLKVNGTVTKELVMKVETEVKVGALLNRLKRVRQENMEAARHALLSNPATQNLIASNDAEAADPTRDPSHCFRAPTARCLLDEATESAKSIPKADMRDWVMGEILTSQARAGLADDAMSTVRRIRDPRLILVALRDIAEAQASAGRDAEAFAAAEIIPTPRKRLEALAVIAAVQAERGESEGARQSAHRMLALLGTIDAPVKRISYIADAAVVLSTAGQQADARARLDEAAALARALDNTKKRETATRRVAAALAEIGLPDQALEMLKEIKDETDRTSVLVAAAKAHAQASDLTKALATAAAIEPPRYRSVVLSHIALAQNKSGDVAGAEASMKEALSLADKIKSSYARNYAMSRIVLAMMEIGKIAGKGIFGLPVDTAHKIKDDQLRAQVLWTISVEGKDAGDPAGLARTEKLAHQATEDIKSPLTRVWMLSDVASNGAAAGAAVAAWKAFRSGLGLAETVRNAWSRARALSKLAATLAELESFGLKASLPPR